MEAGSSRLPTAKPSRGTLVPGGSPPRFSLRGCHPLRRAVPGHFGYRGSAPWGSKPQPGTQQPLIPPRLSREGLVWALPLSVAPTQGIPWWFLLLPLLRCFRSGGSRPVLPSPTRRDGFPDATGSSPVAGGPIRRSRVQRLPAPTPGLSQLATAFLGARAEPSTGRRRCRRPGDEGRSPCPVSTSAPRSGGWAQGPWVTYPWRASPPGQALSCPDPMLSLHGVWEEGLRPPHGTSQGSVLHRAIEGLRLGRIIVPHPLARLVGDPSPNKGVLGEHT